jgi:uncharacterized membrane protein YjgN (DUF898 family)
MTDQAGSEFPGAHGEPSSKAEAPPAGPVQHPLDYTGQAKSLGWLVFKNTILTIITLGFYRFWAKTRIRKYIWSSQSLFGEKLEYTGTGKELFLGFLIVIAVLIPFGIIINVGSFYIQTTGSNAALVAFQVVYYLIFLYLFGYAVYRARRYQLSRTVWRGIRFAQTGDAKKYAAKFFGYSLLTIATLGLAAPLATVRLQTIMFNNTCLGQQEFHLDAQAKDLFWKWVICFVLVPFTLYISMIWYAAFSTRYLVSKTSFGPLRLALPVTFGDFARIYLLYYFLLFAVFGGLGLYGYLIGIPAGQPLPLQHGMPLFIIGFVFFLFLPVITVMMITHRMLALVASKLEAQGEIDLDGFVQNAQLASGTGEGLADALDVGGAAGIEVGL